MTPREHANMRDRISMLGARVAAAKLQPRLLRKAYSPDQAAQEAALMAATMLASGVILRLQASTASEADVATMRRYCDGMPPLVDAFLLAWNQRIGPIPMENAPDGMDLPFIPARILLALLKAYLFDVLAQMPTEERVQQTVHSMIDLIDATRTRLPMPGGAA